MLTRPLVLAMAAALSAVASRADAAGHSLNFEKVFSDEQEPASLRFEATYFAAGKEHRLTLWRLGETRLRRSTDGAVDSYVERKAGDPDFQMTVLDHGRQISTRIDRDTLYRLGNFTDWFDLAHGLRHPRGSYELVKIATPKNAAKPVERCDWYGLRSEGRENRICWSTKYRVPLLIDEPGHGPPAWRVTSLSTRPLDKNDFAFDDSAYVRNDANQDIERD